MDFDKKVLFSELDDEMKKSAKKNDKKEKKHKKLSKHDSFGYGFDPDKLDKKKKKKKSKKDKDDKYIKEETHKKKHKEKKEKPEPLSPEGDCINLNNSKLAKKIMKAIRSKELQEDIKHDKVLIDNKKFWSRD